MSLSSPSDVQRLPLVERWIISLLHKVGLGQQTLWTTVGPTVTIIHSRDLNVTKSVEKPTSVVTKLKEGMGPTGITCGIYYLCNEITAVFLSYIRRPAFSPIPRAVRVAAVADPRRRPSTKSASGTTNMTTTRRVLPRTTSCGTSLRIGVSRRPR